MANNAKLQISKIKDFKSYFGAGSTPYVSLECKTQKGETVPVFISHPNLESMGIKLQLLRNLTVGSSFIVVEESTDRFTGEISTGEETVQKLLSGKLIVTDVNSSKYGKATSILILNRTNCSIIPSEQYDLKSEALVARVDAEISAVQERERKAERAARVNAAFALGAVQQPVTSVSTEEEAELEVNDDDII